MKIDVIKTGYLEENCYILSIDNNCLVIDTGDEFLKIKNKIGDKKVLKVLITHYHFDHVGALNDIKKYYNADVIDYTSNKNQKVGPFTFEIIVTKGHKEDSVTYYFKDEKLMFVGDFIFKGTIGRCDLKGGNYKEMLKSINMIKKYDKDITIYPGHGNSTTLKEEINNNPYLKGDVLWIKK